MNKINQLLVKNKKPLVYLSNDLCRKPCLFTLEEQKALYVIFSYLRGFNKNDTILKISKNDFFNHFPLSSQDKYPRYEKIVYGLQDKSWFAFEDERSKKKGIAIILSDWKKYEDFFLIHLNPEFMPFLEQLAIQFSSHYIDDAMKFTSKYSLACFRYFTSLLGSKETIQNTYFTDKQLKELLNVSEDAYFIKNKFKRRSFERKTLEIAIKEINNLTHLNTTYERAETRGQIFGYTFSYSKKDIALETNCTEVELLDEKPKSLNQTAPSTESPYVEDFCPEPKHIKEDHNLDLQYLLDAEYSEFNAAGINQLKDFKYLRLYDAEIKQYWASIQKVLFSKHACGDGSHCLNDGDHYVIKRSEDKKLVLQKYICQKDKAKRFT